MPYRHNQYQDDLEFDTKAKSLTYPSKAIFILAAISTGIFFLI